MKYLTFNPEGGFPLAVMFSGSVGHDEIAKKIGHPVLGAGFVCIPDATAFPGGFSSSLKVSTHKWDQALIQNSLAATAAAYPPPPTYITPAQRLAAIEAAILDTKVAVRGGRNVAFAHGALIDRIQVILSKPSA